MVRNVLVRLAAGLGVLTLLSWPLAVSAHQEVAAGNYVIEYGWVNEPALVGQPNAVVININPADESHTANTGTISFVTPANMAPVDGDKVEVDIKVDGVDPQAAHGMHWHLMVDDQILAMAPISQTTVTVSGLPNGMHTVTASLASADHGDVGQPAQTMIMVSGSTATNGPVAQDVQPLPTESTGGDFTVDVSALKVEVAYGGQTKILQLQPLADGLPGQYVASFIPTRAGQYTVNLSGKLSGSAGESDVTVSVNPEEVEPVTGYAFPALPTEDSANNFGLTGWLALSGLVVGLVSLVLWIITFSRKR